MLVSEEKLPIEIAEINCIKVNYVDLAEACENEVLEQFASYPTRADHQYACLHGSLAKSFVSI